ncbi:MAG: hypothetical protein IPK95_11715 [Cellvibrionales bacterium]|nr:hypothetical protein [Cellvibrionales bacterium]
MTRPTFYKHFKNKGGNSVCRHRPAGTVFC